QRLHVVELVPGAETIRAQPLGRDVQRLLRVRICERTPRLRPEAARLALEIGHARPSPSSAPARRSRATPTTDAADGTVLPVPVFTYCSLRPRAVSGARGTRGPL